MAIAAIRIAAIPKLARRFIIPSWEKTAFRCSNGDAQYKILRLEAAKKMIKRAILVTAACFMRATRKFALKYFRGRTLASRFHRLPLLLLAIR